MTEQLLLFHEHVRSRVERVEDAVDRGIEHSPELQTACVSDESLIPFAAGLAERTQAELQRLLSGLEPLRVPEAGRSPEYDAAATSIFVRQKLVRCALRGINQFHRTMNEARG